MQSLAVRTMSTDERSLGTPSTCTHSSLTTTNYAVLYQSQCIRGSFNVYIFTSYQNKLYMVLLSSSSRVEIKMNVSQIEDENDSDCSFLVKMSFPIHREDKR